MSRKIVAVNNSKTNSTIGEDYLIKIQPNFDAVNNDNNILPKYLLSMIKLLKRGKDKASDYRARLLENAKIVRDEKVVGLLERIARRKNPKATVDGGGSSASKLFGGLGGLLANGGVLLTIVGVLKKLFGLKSKLMAAALLFGAFKDGGLEGGVKSLLNGTSTFIKGLTGGLVKLWTPEQVNSFIATSKETFKAIGDNWNKSMGELYDKLPTSVKDTISTFASRFSDGMDIIRTNMGEAIDVGIKLIKERVKAFRDLIVSNAKALKDKVDSKIESVKSKVTKKVESVKNTISTSVTNFIDEYSSIDTLRKKKGKEKLIMKKTKARLDKRLREAREKIESMQNLQSDNSVGGTAKRLFLYGTKNQLSQKIKVEENKLKRWKSRSVEINTQLKEVDERIAEIETLKRELRETELRLKSATTKKETRKEEENIVRVKHKKEVLNSSLINLMNQVFKGEGTSDEKAKQKGYKNGYDVTLGYGAYDGGKHKPITEMTLGELDVFQTKMLRHPKNKLNSSAVGKVQVIRTTMRELKKNEGWDDDTLFDAELQQKIFKLLLEKRGLSKFKSGDISKTTFQNNIAKEWASIARADTKKSHYGQHTGTSDRQISERITEVHNHYNNPTTTNNHMAKTDTPTGDIKVSVDLRGKNKGNVV